MNLQKSLEKLQGNGKYSISVSPTLKNGQLQYQLKNNGYIKYTGSEVEISAFIDGMVSVINYKEPK